MSKYHITNYILHVVIMENGNALIGGISDDKTCDRLVDSKELSDVASIISSTSKGLIGSSIDGYASIISSTSKGLIGSSIDGYNAISCTCCKYHAIRMEG